MDVNNLVLGIFDGIGTFDFNTALKVVGLLFIIFWIMVSGWVFLDARERSQSKGFQILSFVFVLLFNLPGLFIYMIIRPKATIQEQYWADLEKRYLLYETAELFDCPKCGYPLQPGFVNCPNCAEVIKVKCECGVNIDKYWKHCPFCGRANNKAKTFQQTVAIVKENVNENERHANQKREEERQQERKNIGMGLNSVFKQTQTKLSELKTKLGTKKEPAVNHNVVEKKNKKGKKKK